MVTVPRPPPSKLASGPGTRVVNTTRSRAWSQPCAHPHRAVQEHPRQGRAPRAVGSSRCSLGAGTSGGVGVSGIRAGCCASCRARSRLRALRYRLLSRQNPTPISTRPESLLPHTIPPTHTHPARPITQNFSLAFWPSGLVHLRQLPLGGALTLAQRTGNPYSSPLLISAPPAPGQPLRASPSGPQLQRSS